MQIGQEIFDLLALSVKEKASDLYLASLSPPILRINGQLVPVKNYSPLPSDKLKNII